MRAADNDEILGNPVVREATPNAVMRHFCYVLFIMLLLVHTVESQLSKALCSLLNLLSTLLSLHYPKVFP